MDFRLPEEVEMLKQTVRDFVYNTVDPRAQEIEEKDEIPAEIWK